MDTREHSYYEISLLINHTAFNINKLNYNRQFTRIY